MQPSLIALGFTPFFSAQLTLDEWQHGVIARVMQVQRSNLLVSDGQREFSLLPGGAMLAAAAEHRATVGDWLVLDAEGQRIERLLERRSLFKRIAAGDRADIQLIAANVDTLFIVTSCNHDFNESRIERYLALASEAGVDPVLIVTRADLTDDADQYLQRAAQVKADLPVELINAMDPESVTAVEAWISPGATVALLGSSGVGKSTIVNLLSGRQVAQTAGIREQDSRGRHTTSARSLHVLANGGLLLDVPGMRELKVAQLDDALADVFSEIELLARQCSFSDCAHGEEPGCAVAAALRAGTLDKRRWQNYQKLLAEEFRNNRSLAERRQRDRKFGKMVRRTIQNKQRDRR